MGQITYIDKFDSADQLDKIMCSYQGWHRGTVMSDQRGLTVLLSMLTHGEITITQHSYPFDSYIRENAEMMKVYRELALRTRWKLFEHTEIEGIRINALRQTRQAGVPSFDDYICYQEGRINVLCGNIDPGNTAKDTGRAIVFKQFGKALPQELQHISRDASDFPLGTIASSQSDEQHQFPSIHCSHDVHDVSTERKIVPVLLQRIIFPNPSQLFICLGKNVHISSFYIRILLNCIRDNAAAMVCTLDRGDDNRLHTMADKMRDT